MRHILLAGLTFSGLTAFAQTPTPQLSCDHAGYHNDRLVSHCEMKEQTLGTSRGPIDVNPGMNGGVTVRGWDRGDILLRAQVITSAETDEGARAMTSQIRLASGAGQIKAEGPELNNRQSWSVSYELFVPRQSDVHAVAHNGGIKIANVRGTIQFEAVNGGVVLSGLSGEVKGHTANGGLTIELAGNRWDGTGMDVATTNGGVKMDVPSNYSAHFETATTNGGINVDFPISVSGKIDREASFDVGGGGPTIRVITTNGGVKIRKS